MSRTFTLKGQQHLSSCSLFIMRIQCFRPLRDDPVGHSLPAGQPLLHVRRLRPQQHRPRSASPNHPGLRLWDLFHPFRYPSLRSPPSPVCPRHLSSVELLSLCLSGLALVVGLVLYISSINDEVLNRTKSSEAYFAYKYGWSFAFAAFSFLLTEVRN